MPVLQLISIGLLLYSVSQCGKSSADGASKRPRKPRKPRRVRTPRSRS